MAVLPKKFKMSESTKSDWKEPHWYQNNVKDSIGSYHLEIPIGKFSHYNKQFLIYVEIRVLRELKKSMHNLKKNCSKSYALSIVSVGNV